MRINLPFGVIGAIGLAILGCGGGGVSTTDAASPAGGSKASGGVGAGTGGAAGDRGGAAGGGAGGSPELGGSAGGAGIGGTAGRGGMAGAAGGVGGTAGSGAAGIGGAAGGGQAGLTGFVTRQGMQFIEGGKRHVVVGANFWQGMSLGATAAGGDRARLTRELDRLQLLGVNNIRMVAAAEGPDSAQPSYRIVPSLMPMPGVYNEQVFQGLDVFLDELAKRGMRAVMVLNNYWEWSGGFGQYVSWSDGSKIPDRIANSSLYSSYVTYVDRFYACTTCQAAYRAHINTLIKRVNTVNGRTYRDDPAIFAWQLANEPRDYPANWINDTALYIKSLDPNHMVTVGSEGSWGGDFTTTHQSQYIDYTTCHIWVEPWGKYSATDSSAGNLQSATSFATTYLQNHDTMAKQLGKPLIMEEFGLARDGWAPGGKTDPASPTTNRDKYYKSLYAVVEASLAKSGNALAGDNFWAWGGEARPPSKWTGDPPHEPAGWFSVYDMDTSTTAIISTHGAAIKTAAR